MAKTRTAKIESIQAEIQQLENQRKKLIQQEKEQERKDRTKRLCRRAGLLESLLPDTIPLTDEQFKILLEKALLSDYTRRILDGLKAQSTATATQQPAGTAQENGEDGSKNEGNSARVTG